MLVILEMMKICQRDVDVVGNAVVVFVKCRSLPHVCVCVCVCVWQSGRELRYRYIFLGCSDALELPEAIYRNADSIFSSVLPLALLLSTCV